MPEAPELLEVSCNERRALLRWSRPPDHADPILEFRLQLNTDFERDKWTTVLHETDTKSASYQAEITLSPWVCAVYETEMKAFRSTTHSGNLKEQNVSLPIYRTF